MTLTLNEYRRRMTAGTIRKATVTEIATASVVWFDFGRGRQYRLPFILL